MAATLKIERRALEGFCREHGISRLALFGSALGDDFGPASDLDLVVEFVPGTRVGLMGLGRLEMALSELLGRTVDLNTPNGLHRRFRDRALAEAQVVYAA